jgi:hypothetical protein
MMNGRKEREPHGDDRPEGDQQDDHGATSPTPSRSPGPFVSAKRTDSPPRATCTPGRWTASTLSRIANITDWGTSVAPALNWMVA